MVKNVLSRLFLTGFLLLPPLAAWGEVKVLAIVNGKAVTSLEVVRIAQGGLSPQQALERAINNQLLVGEAERQGFAVTESEVEAEFNRILARFPEPTLFYQQLSKEGLTAAAFREELRQQLLVRKLIQNNLLNRIQIDPVELAVYWNEHREEFCLAASRFHLRVAEFEDKEAIPPNPETMMEDLGFLPYGDLAPAVQEALAGRKVGEITPPVFSAGHWLVFQIVAIEQPPPDSYQIAFRAREALYQQKYEAAYQELVNRLKATADITYTFN